MQLHPRSPKSGLPTLLPRTAAGGLVDAATIVRLYEETDGDEIRWGCECPDGG
jgi:hypothetical protein